MYKSELLVTLEERGFLYQTSHGDDFDHFCCHNTLTAYVGFDATAPSLQVGNLMMLMLSLWMKRMGHLMILLVGGGTTKIGDPSWKDKLRPLLSEENIQENILGLKDAMVRVLGKDVLIVDNASWLDALSYIPFLRDIGIHFSINRMLALDHVKSRLDQDLPLSFIEFNYPIMQAYDFLELHRRYGCSLQFGGSDQWGNIITGVDLVRRITGKAVYGMTTPLLQTSSGEKMGKTAQGAIWLNADRTSAYDYWQFWRNVDDQDVIRFLKLYTLLPMSDIHRLAGLEGKEMNEAKKILADETTALLHGKNCLNDIHDTASAVFSQGIGGDLLPSYKLAKPVSVVTVLKELGFTSSLTQGRQKIKEGAVKIDGHVVHDVNQDVHDGTMISLGKRHARLIHDLKMSE